MTQTVEVKATTVEERVSRIETALVSLTCLTLETSQPDRLRAQWSQFPGHVQRLADALEEIKAERADL